MREPKRLTGVVVQCNRIVPRGVRIIGWRIGANDDAVETVKDMPVRYEIHVVLRDAVGVGSYPSAVEETRCDPPRRNRVGSRFGAYTKCDHAVEESTRDETHDEKGTARWLT